MGTNYYTKKRCAHCGSAIKEEMLHIGKSSGGWKFLFAAYPNMGLTSWKAWRMYLSDGDVHIEDEYGVPETFSGFVRLVETKQRPDALDAMNATTSQWGPTPAEERHKYENADPEGYRFSTSSDFS